MGIRILPKGLTDKIAAGEVIERPASVVKELVENSIDAGARRIEVELEDGGAKLIRVGDDGCGMDEGDVALAFVSHATSKLAGEDDLFNVRTMGFRGEALASIASVSQARLVSRTHEAEAGHEVRAEGGEIGPVKACGAPPGTMVEARNLFYNVPVRRKFLKTPATEMAHITEAVTRLALPHPNIAFVLTHNGRTVFNLAAADDCRQRLSAFFGGEIADGVIPVSARFPEVEIEGYLLPPSVDRANATMQYTFVNHRYVRDRTLMHAIEEAYRGLLMTGRRPVCFMFLTVDPREVDVNVHPSKIEVRFRKGRDVHVRLLTAARDALRQAKLTPQVSLTPPAEKPGDRTESVRRALGDFFAGRREAASGRAGASDRSDALDQRRAVPSPVPREPAAPSAASQAPPAEGPPMEVHYGGLMQVLDAYIVEETPEGIRVIDQHALHERILYEDIRRRIESGPLASQRLLVPDLVELPKAEFFAVLELKDDLARFGMEMEAFGENTVIVRSFPQVLGKFDGLTFFRELLAELEGPEGARKVDGRLDRIVMLMSCRGAVRSGQRLSPRQMKLILEQAAHIQADTCPHGRPTAILISRKELEKHFGR